MTLAERTRRRVTWRLMPFLVLVYLTAFIDRANVSVAKIGMQRDLGLTDAAIGFGAGVFFIGYFLLEIPSALIVERWSARKWLARIMITWGCTATLSGFAGLIPVPLGVQAQFYWLRFLLGAAEAGFFPGVIVYLAHWFRPEDRPRAKAWFMIAQPLAVVIGVPLSRWILEALNWRWVFILEGIPPVLLGFFALYWLTDRPADARWLAGEERDWLIARLAEERHESVGILAAFRRPRTLLLTACFFLIVTGNQALLFFLPSIANNMKSMSISWRTVVTILPYVFSVAGILLNGYLRLPPALPMFLAGASLSFAIVSGNHLGLVITFLCLVGFTFQAYLPVFWAIPSSYLGKSAAAAAVGLINSFGNLGGFVGPYLFGYLSTATGSYTAGLWCLTGFMFLASALALRVRE